MSSNDSHKIPDSESEEMTEEKKKALRNLPDKRKRYTEPEDLPNWAKRAITLYELGKYNTVEEAATDHDRSKRTLDNYRATPAGREWKKRVSEVRDDPQEMARMLLRGSIHHFTADLVSMWRVAKEAEDYEWIRKAWKDIAEGVAPEIAPKASAEGAQANQIVINMPSAAAEEPVKVEPVEAEVIEEPDD